MKNVTQYLYISIIVALLTVSGLASGPDLTAEKILEEYQSSMSALEDVKSEAKLAMNLVLGFLPYSENLKGRYYYQKPNKHRLEFDDAPSYFDKAPSMFNWNLPSLEKYRVKASSPEASGKHTHYTLLFRPKKAESSTQSVTCTFQAENWKLLQQKTSYRDGGSVTLNFTYLKGSELPILDEVQASVSIPAYSLTGGATISFSNQISNKGLEPNIFEENAE